MKLTKKSELLMSFFIENKCNSYAEISKKTQVIFENFYQEIKEAESYIESLKAKYGNFFYNLIIKEIETFSQIPKPNTFPADGFPPQIREYIHETIVVHLHYSVNLIGRKIQFHFLLEDSYAHLNISLYNNYVDHMLIWLLLLDGYASKKCAEELVVYLYFTGLEKKVPSSSIHILNENNVNTAFTMTCPKISEIVIFRREEWFKVFIHETFHNFGLDFSDMSNELCKKRILAIFPVKSEVNLYEAYAEFWAKIMNALFCSYRNLKNKKDVEEFILNAEFFINFERIYSLFQMVKVLDFMNLSYAQLYKKGLNHDNVRKMFYKENTNVLSYYIITFLLLYDYSSFIQWCKTNNISLLSFKKTFVNQISLCKYIESKYKTNKLLHSIFCTEGLFKKLKKNKNNSKHKQELHYIMNNLRMSICELG